MMEFVCAVYKIINKVTGDSYIGSSKNCHRRWMEHSRPSKKHYARNRMYQDMEKYGIENFEMFPILFVDEENLRNVEQEAINFLKPTYNQINSYGSNLERQKETNKREYERYYKRMCNYEGELLSLNTLAGRFKRRHYETPTQEAKKYLIGETA